MNNKEFKNIEISEILFKSSDILAIKLIRTITNSLFFTYFINFKKFIALQFFFNERLLSSIDKKNYNKNLDTYIIGVQSHSAILQKDILGLKISTKKLINNSLNSTQNELMGWLYVYYFFDYFSSFYFKELNINTFYCETQKYLMLDTFYKKKKWNLFNNFLNKNCFDEKDKVEIIKSVEEHSKNYLELLSEVSNE